MRINIYFQTNPEYFLHTFKHKAKYMITALIHKLARLNPQLNSNPHSWLLLILNTTWINYSQKH